MKTVAGVAAATWGLVGVVALLGRAIARLYPPAIDAFNSSLTPWHWVLLAASLFFMGYFEGYRGFQRGFAPRVVVRALHLAREPRLLHALLAPLYVMGLIHASRRRLITGWSVVTMIVLLVLGVRHVAQPYRGLIDAGVVLGLAWGLASVLAFTIAALAKRPPDAVADLPQFD